MNTPLLKSKMILYGDEDFVNALAGVLNVSRQTAAAKLNNESECTRPEIAKISKRYSLSDEEIRKIFIEGDEEVESERSS